MKYKNYRNPYTDDNRIFSFTDIYNMPLKEVLKRKQELLGQYRVLGVPIEEELQASDNVVHVEAYTREDGTEVRGYWRSKPDGITSNNFSQGKPTGGASNIDENKQNDLLKNNQKSDGKITKEERIEKMMYPDEVAGVKRGEPMTFEQMMQHGVNPKYMSDEDENGEYSNNCACCAVAGLLVLRGYDVEAGSADNPIAKELSNVDKSAYLDPESGEECVPQKIDIDNVNCYDYLEQNIKQGEVHEFSYYTQRELFYGESAENTYNNQKTQGHIVLITRNEKNDLVWYDPQDGYRHEGVKDVKAVVNSWVNERTLFNPRILRVDDKALNPKYVNAVVRKRN